MSIAKFKLPIGVMFSSVFCSIVSANAEELNSIPLNGNDSNFIIVGSSVPPFPENMLPPQTEEEVATDHLLIKVSFETNAESAIAMMFPEVQKMTPLLSGEAFFGLEKITPSELSRVYIVELAPSSSLVEMIEAFSALPFIDYAEPDVVMRAVQIPNDPYFNQQWALNNTGQTGGTPDADIDAPEAWDISEGSSGVMLGIIDSGVDPNHQDLNGKVMNGYDFANNDFNPMDDHGHGTHIAGIAAANSNEGIGIAGVCPKCRILPVKVLTDTGWGYSSWIAQGIAYATSYGADVINLSLGGTTYSSVLHDAIKYAYQKEIAVIAAAGNSGSTPILYPAKHPESIAVAATDHNDNNPWFSNYGPEMDIAAPGSSILSSLPNNEYTKWSGTSMATPHVTGAAGVLLSLKPDLTPEEMRTCLRETADDLGTSGWDEYYGAGRLNLETLVSVCGESESSTCHGKACTIIGTAGNDILYGTNDDDVICGKGGNDIIKAKGGNDTLCGDAGDDKLYGHWSNDYLDGGSGNDLLNGGGGDDTCVNGETIKRCES